MKMPPGSCQLRARDWRRGCFPFTFVVMMLAGCSGPPTPPTNPSHLASVVALSVSGAGVPLVEGRSVQLTATATLSDGTSADVTSQASWASGNTAVATISPGGLLAAVGPGEASLVARYQHVTAQAPVVVGFDVSGVIHEAEPSSKPIANVQVEVVGGPLDGQKVTTDDGGRFSVPGVTGPGFALLFSKDGYETVRREVAELPRDARSNVILLQAEKTFTWESFARSGLFTFPITISRKSPVNLTFVGEGECRLQGTYTDTAAGLYGGPSPPISIFPYPRGAGSRWFASYAGTVLAGEYQLRIFMNYVWTSSKCRLTVTLKYY